MKAPFSDQLYQTTSVAGLSLKRNSVLGTPTCPHCLWLCCMPGHHSCVWVPAVASFAAGDASRTAGKLIIMLLNGSNCQIFHTLVVSFARDI